MSTTPTAAPSRRRRSRQRGQSLVIFSLVAVVLFGVVGFAVDGGFSYFVSDRLERGAMAAALAGVPNMPNFNTGPNDASSTAVSAAALNGWSSGGATNVSVTTAKVWDSSTGTYYRNRLAVTVAADVPVFFMKLLGFGTHREARTAIAEYLRPITLGQPGNQLGSDLAGLGTGSNFYFMRSEGWGTDRGQGDAYGPNPTGWGGANASTPNTDVHALSNTMGTEATTQPFTLPDRGGANYQVYVPAGQTTSIKVYNPLFAPDSQTTTGNANGYNYHEDDGDFPENCSTSPCTTPTNIQQWPTMSYTVYKTPNPFDHTQDVWYSNLRIKSIDATLGPSQGKYTVPGSTTTCTTAAPCLLNTLTNTYHAWMDISAAPADAAAAQLTTLTKSGSFASLSGGANGTTYRLRVDQLDDTSSDPGANGRAQNLNSQAHKGYAVQATGCTAPPSPTSCSITALNDITLYTPIKSGGGQIPLVSIPPEYAGRSFSLYVYDPGDVTCNSTGCSNILTVMRPNGYTGTSPTTTANAQVAVTGGGGVWSTGAGEGDANNAATWTQQVTPCSTCSVSIETQDPTAAAKNKFNGKWLRFDIAVPSNYATADIDAANPATWFWNMNYSTAQPAGDTITANLGFTGAPVHIISG
jgi:nitrate reductase NapE component